MAPYYSASVYKKPIEISHLRTASNCLQIKEKAMLSKCPLLGGSLYNNIIQAALLLYMLSHAVPKYIYSACTTIWVLR